MNNTTFNVLDYVGLVGGAALLTTFIAVFI
ncbi:DUF3948 family protein [Bacillus manliponensis]|nr:DUF3948 family protein [Bacillus manliponensis]